MAASRTVIGMARATAVVLLAVAASGCLSLGGRRAARVEVGDPAPVVSGTMRPYQVRGRWYRPEAQPNYDETGLASWYGDAFNGRPTSTGEIFDMHGLTAAHKTLPLPSLIEVTNVETGRSLILRVNDRGPFVDGRILDLSRGAADELGILRQGVGRVRVRYVGPAPRLGGANAPRMQQASSAPARPPVARGGGYLVQAAAYTEQANAMAALRRLDGVDGVRIDTVRSGGARVYRLVMGPWPDANQAEVARSRLAGYGFVDALLLPAG